MSKIVRRCAESALILSLCTCPMARVRAQSTTDVSFDTAQEALVDLGKLWQRATNGVPLSSQLVDTYLAGAEVRPVSTPSTSSPALLGGQLLLEPKTPEATSTGAIALPIRPVSPADAREVYRRQAFLALYLQKHDAVLAVVRSGKVPLSVRMSEDDIALFGRQAVAARAELFLIERIAFGEGENQAQKCLAFGRADAHARALGLGATPARVADVDVPPGWRSTLATARAQHAATHAREARLVSTLCTQGGERSRTQVRQQLQDMLEARLAANIDDYFSDKAVELRAVQARFTELSNASATLVPRAEIAALEKQVTDAKSVYDLVGNDVYGLKARIDRLKQATTRALAQLQGDATPASTFAAETRELARLQGELTKFLALAKSLGAIRFSAARDRQALEPCAKLPDKAGPQAAGVDLAAAIDTCLTSAAALRARLVTAPDISPERDAFMRQLEILSAAYLTANRW